MFRPRGLAPPRRLAPLRGCGLVASRSRTWGSLRFADSTAAPLESDAAAVLGSRSAWSLRSIPPVSSRTASPRPLPSCRYLGARSRRAEAHRDGPALITPLEVPVARQPPGRGGRCEAGFKALLRRRVDDATLAVKPTAAPCPSMGFSPPSRCAPRHPLRGPWGPRRRSDAPHARPKPVCDETSRPDLDLAASAIPPGFASTRHRGGAGQLPGVCPESEGVSEDTDLPGGS